MMYKAVIVAMLLAFVAPAVVADDIGVENDSDSDAKTFAQFDKNGNGQLEEIEIMEANEERNWDGTEFEELDKNEDSVVTHEEWTEYFQA